MKVALVYTVVNDSMRSHLENIVHTLIGQDTEILSLSDPSILQSVLEAGKITPEAAKKVLALYLQAMEQGAKGILSVCSSVGGVADAMAQLNAYTGVPVVRIDDEMCRRVAQKESVIAAAATFPTAMESTKEKLHREAKMFGKTLAIEEIMIQGGCQSQHLGEEIARRVRELPQMPDVLMLCQASMASVGQWLSQELSLRVYTSPEDGVRQLRKMMKEDSSQVSVP